MVSKPIVVQKYGGSSVADVTRIGKVAQRIVETARSGKGVVVVVSAMGDTTDELLAQAKSISSSPSRREMDMLLSCGERASMALLSMAVGELGLEAISFTGSQCGIMTNDRHSGARIIEVRPVRVQDELARGRVVIVAGFQGVSYKREITTLGRGGSDTTAVALAAALGAEYCEICSDVDGIYSADPREVKAAALLEAISHDQMIELAAHGARVLHAESVEFARQAGIALYARATNQGGQGTRIDFSSRLDCAGVTTQKGLVRIRTSSLAETLRSLGSLKVPLFQSIQLQDVGYVWCVLDDVPDWPKHESQFPDATSAQGCLSLVGDLIGKRAEVAAQLIEISRSHCAQPQWVTTPVRTSIFCHEDELSAMLEEAHGIIERESKLAL